MKTTIILAILLCALSFGSWASWRKGSMCELSVALVGSVLCPVRGAYPSIVSAELQLEIVRRQGVLRDRLGYDVQMYKSTAIDFGLVGFIVVLLMVFSLGQTKKMLFLLSG